MNWYTLLAALLCTSLSIGLVAVLLWVSFWGIAFSEAWPGYDAHTMRVFWLSFIATNVGGVAKLILR